MTAPFPAKSARQRLTWRRAGKTLAGTAPVLVAVAAAAFALIQANAAGKQNADSERQELISLVASIAQEPQNIDQAKATFKANQSELHSAESDIQLAELADAEEAADVIRLLNKNGVTAVEYYETATGLQAGQSDHQALQLLKQAAALPNVDPRTQANILHEEAQIHYALGPRYYSTAETEDRISGAAFNSGPDIPPLNRLNNIAYTKLFDAYFQATISCATAVAEQTAAESLVAENPGIDSVGMRNQEQETAAAIEKAHCGTAT